MPANPPLLDWLASEFVERGFSMKAMHRLIVTSETYKLASEADAGAQRRPTRRSIRTTPTSGTSPCDGSRPSRSGIRSSPRPATWTCPSAARRSTSGRRRRRGEAAVAADAADSRTNRRAAYMIRGYSTSRDVVPNFLQAFDVDDGRPVPGADPDGHAPAGAVPDEQRRDRDGVRDSSPSGSEGVRRRPRAAVDLAYRIALARPPSAAETDSRAGVPRQRPGPAEGPGVAAVQPREFIYVR